MKEISIVNGVVSETPTQCPAHVVKPELCYGIQNQFGEKGFIHRTEWGKGVYKSFCSIAITKGNNWDFLTPTDNLEVLVQNVLHNKFQVFVFEKERDLFKWLSE